MRPYSQDAHEFKLGLEAGVVNRREVFAWADRILADYPYDDDVANLALANTSSDKELLIFLGNIIESPDDESAVRKIMGRMFRLLSRDRERAHSFTKFLEHFWIQQDYTVPEDMEFICGIEDAFSLAHLGVYGTVEQATDSLLANLARFDNGTEQAEDAKPDNAPS